MSTLLSVGNSEGTRRCDERCYDATHGQCTCCCGGRNHGVGLIHAIDNTRELADSWLDAEAARRGVSRADLTWDLHPEARQEVLFAF